jgi:hypothetical protein
MCLNMVVPYYKRRPDPPGPLRAARLTGARVLGRGRIFLSFPLVMEAFAGYGKTVAQVTTR